MKYVDMYGFDFDYTLVHYKQSVLDLIYGLAKNRLVEQLNVCDTSYSAIFERRINSPGSNTVSYVYSWVGF